jgi:hypothetical protein
MARKIPSFPNPHDANNPYRDAYAWLAGLSLTLSTKQGQITFNVHPNESAWQDKPVDRIEIALGQVLGPGAGWEPPATFPTFDEFMARPAFAAACATILADLYAAAVATHPLLAGSVEV